MGSYSSPSDSSFSFKPVLHTPRLTLTVFDENRPDHYDHVIACFQDPVSLREMGDMGIRTHEHLKALSHNMLLSSSFCSGNTPHEMAVYNIHLGSSPTDPKFDQPRSALKNCPSGRGEISRYMAEEYGVTEMVALIKPTNAVCIRVAENIGFVEPGETMTEDGHPTLIFTLKGMKKIDPNTRINFYSDGEEGKRLKEMTLGDAKY
ncbi:hypothetical protein MMC15_002514 [Xylographa vitiligo]|nr:hypothetical protein [Xylographa vitiligo]